MKLYEILYIWTDTLLQFTNRYTFLYITNPSKKFQAGMNQMKYDLVRLKKLSLTYFSQIVPSFSQVFSDETNFSHLLILNVINVLD